MQGTVPVEVIAEGQDERNAAEALLGDRGHLIGDFGLWFTATAACMAPKFETSSLRRLNSQELDATVSPLTRVER
jgi:hypothetical protein